MSKIISLQIVTGISGILEILSKESNLDVIKNDIFISCVNNNKKTSELVFHVNNKMISGLVVKKDWSTEVIPSIKGFVKINQVKSAKEWIEIIIEHSPFEIEKLV
jgi:hypothetical protein